MVARAIKYKSARYFFGDSVGPPCMAGTCSRSHFPEEDEERKGSAEHCVACLCLCLSLSPNFRRRNSTSKQQEKTRHLADDTAGVCRELPHAGAHAGEFRERVLGHHHGQVQLLGPGGQGGLNVGRGGARSHDPKEHVTLWWRGGRQCATKILLPPTRKQNSHRPAPGVVRLHRGDRMEGAPTRSASCAGTPRERK